MDEQQTPEDDIGELHLRALMPWLRDQEHREFDGIQPMRAGVLAHTELAADKARGEIADRFGVPNDVRRLTTQAQAYVYEPIDNDERRDQPCITRAERYRRVIGEADRGYLVRGRFSQLWKDLCFYAG